MLVVSSRSRRARQAASTRSRPQPKQQIAADRAGDQVQRCTTRSRTRAPPASRSPKRPRRRLAVRAIRGRSRGPTRPAPTVDVPDDKELLSRRLRFRRRRRQRGRATQGRRPGLVRDHRNRSPHATHLRRGQGQGRGAWRADETGEGARRKPPTSVKQARRRRDDGRARPGRRRSNRRRRTDVAARRRRGASRRASPARCSLPAGRRRFGRRRRRARSSSRCTADATRRRESDDPRQRCDQLDEVRCHRAWSINISTRSSKSSASRSTGVLQAAEGEAMNDDPTTRRLRPPLRGRARERLSTTLVADLETPVSAYLEAAAGAHRQHVPAGIGRGRRATRPLFDDRPRSRRHLACRGDRAEINRRALTDLDAFDRCPANRSRRCARCSPNRASSCRPACRRCRPACSAISATTWCDRWSGWRRAKPDPIGVPDAMLIRPTVMVVFDFVARRDDRRRPRAPAAGVGARAA